MVGLITFLASEVMLFGAFFTAFFYIRYANYPVFPPHPYDLPKKVTGINAGILISSSFTMHWALMSVKRNNRTGLVLGLLFTLLLGLTFLGIQIHEYATIGFRPRPGPSPRPSSASPACTAPTSSSAPRCSRWPSSRSLRGHSSPEKHLGIGCRDLLAPSSTSCG